MGDELTFGAGLWDDPTMILTLDSKRRLTLPSALCAAKPGDHFTAVFDAEEVAIVFRRLTRRADWLEVLRSCPVSLDNFPARCRELPKRRTALQRWLSPLSLAATI